MSERHFTLVIPGLLGPPRDPSGHAPSGHAMAWPEGAWPEGDRPDGSPRRGYGGVAVPVPGLVPTLETLLARAETTGPARGTTESLESSLFRLFGLPSTADADLPVAAVTRAAEGGAPDDGWWLRADPVCLLPQGVGLLLQPAEELGLTLEQARALVEEILQVFAADGWHLEAPVAHRWYLRPATPPDMKTTPLARVAGRDILAYLPTGKDAKAWHVALNEIQILLHTAGVNVERESRGLVPINSVWFWGGGQRPILPKATWTRLWSNEVLSRGLATLAGVMYAPLPLNAHDWLAQAAAGQHLLVMDADTTLSRAAESDRWQEFFMRLEQHWLAPLMAAVKSGHLDSVTLQGEKGHRFRITRKDLGRWWRRRRALTHYQ